MSAPFGGIFPNLCKQSLSKRNNRNNGSTILDPAERSVDKGVNRVKDGKYPTIFSAPNVSAMSHVENPEAVERIESINFMSFLSSKYWESSMDEWVGFKGETPYLRFDQISASKFILFWDAKFAHLSPFLPLPLSPHHPQSLSQLTLKVTNPTTVTLWIELKLTFCLPTMITKIQQMRNGWQRSGNCTTNLFWSAKFVHAHEKMSEKQSKNQQFRAHLGLKSIC